MYIAATYTVTVSCTVDDGTVHYIWTTQSPTAGRALTQQTFTFQTKKGLIHVLVDKVSIRK